MLQHLRAEVGGGFGVRYDDLGAPSSDYYLLFVSEHSGSTLTFLKVIAQR